MSRRPGRATLGLWNSYDPNRFREAHRRVLARAGPLALAYELNLAAFGFPFPQELSTPQEIADWVATTTSIGEDGAYLKELAAKGRFQTFPYASKGFPPQLGELVLTTCDPDPSKAITARGVAAMLLGGGSVCLLFGTGPKGAPKAVREMAPCHLDITFGGHSLETCTALGAVAAVIAHELRR